MKKSQTKLVKNVSDVSAGIFALISGFLCIHSPKTLNKATTISFHNIQNYSLKNYSLSRNALLRTPEAYSAL